MTINHKKNSQKRFYRDIEEKSRSISIFYKEKYKERKRMRDA